MEEQGLFRLFNPLSPTTRRTTRALQEIQAQRMSGIFAIDEMRITNANTNMLTPPAAIDHRPPNVLRPANSPNVSTNATTNTNNTNTTTTNNTNNLNVLNNFNMFNNLFNSPDRTLAPLAPERRRLSGNFDLSDHHDQSPDEAAIQARGRRSIPLTYSPDINHTPLRQQMQRAKLNMITQANSNGRLLLPTSRDGGVRTSPRKRLTLSDTPPSSVSPSPCLGTIFTPSPDKINVSPLTKKVKLDPTATGISPEVAMKGLSQQQLTDLLSSLLGRHPELREEVVQLLPAPDMAPLESRLNYLKKNIYKALPSTRLESKTDSLAFNRVSTHLATFKKAVLEQLKPLLEGEQWLVVLDYCVLAWGYVKATPVWENPSHNNTRKGCFRSLAAACMTALRRGKFSSEELNSIKTKLSRLQADSEEVVVCLKYIEEMDKEKGSS